MKTLRLRFWLLAMDAARLAWGFGSKPYLYACTKAMDVEFEGYPAVPFVEDEEAPF